MEQVRGQTLSSRSPPALSFFSVSAQIPVVNDDLPARIISGRVKVKPNVKEFHSSTVVFVDGSFIDKVSGSGS